MYSLFLFRKHPPPPPSGALKFAALFVFGWSPPPICAFALYKNDAANRNRMRRHQEQLIASQPPQKQQQPKLDRDRVYWPIDMCTDVPNEIGSSRSPTTTRLHRFTHHNCRRIITLKKLRQPQTTTITTTLITSTIRQIRTFANHSRCRRRRINGAHRFYNQSQLYCANSRRRLIITVANRWTPRVELRATDGRRCVGLPIEINSKYRKSSIRWKERCGHLCSGECELAIFFCLRLRWPYFVFHIANMVSVRKLN